MQTKYILSGLRIIASKTYLVDGGNSLSFACTSLERKNQKWGGTSHVTLHRDEKEKPRTRLCFHASTTHKIVNNKWTWNGSQFQERHCCWPHLQRIDIIDFGPNRLDVFGAASLDNIIHSRYPTPYLATSATISDPYTQCQGCKARLAFGY